MDDRLFQQLLDKFELSWEGYRKVRKGVKKRISRYVQQQGYGDWSAFLSELDRSPTVRQQCELLLTVSISRFFRDRQLWNSLENSLLPAIVENHTREILAWSAGCARGEEAYSLKIVWDRLRRSNTRLPELKVTATDLNPDYIEKARKGIYAASSLKELSEDRKAEYFKPLPGGRRFAIKECLKADVNWNVRHLLEDAPKKQFQLIFLRNNLLTYYQAHLKLKAFNKIVDCLSPSGILIIGSHENLPLHPPDLQPFSGYSYVFIKRNLPV
jgi:chemotaxis methyl-accepting protein methylase